MSVWRVGGKLKRTLYKHDQLVGLVDTAEIAAEIVETMNRVGRLLDEVRGPMAERGLGSPDFPWIRRIIDEDVAPVPHYACTRCGALVANSQAGKHADFHQEIENLISGAEYEDALRREQQERPSG